MRVFFAGTPDFSVEVLRALLDSSDISVVGILTQSDRPAGRKMELKAPAVKAFALETCSEIPLFQCEKIGADLIAQIRALKPDFIVVVAFGMLLKSDFLDIAPCINLHASLLPKYRGASPIQAQILNAEKFLGVTAMRINLGLDSGDMLGFCAVKNNGEDAESAFGLLSKMAGSLAVKTLREFDNIAPLAQNHALATHCKKISKKDGELDLESAVETYLKSLAFSPWPGVFLPNGLKLFGIRVVETRSKNPQKGKILSINKESSGEIARENKESKSSEILSENKETSGKIACAEKKSSVATGAGKTSAPTPHTNASFLSDNATDCVRESIVITCAIGSISIDFLQAPNKNKISAPAYLNGAKLTIGDILL